MNASLVSPPLLIGAIRMDQKNEIAAALAASGNRAGVVAYHRVRDDGTCTCGDFNHPDTGNDPVLELGPHAGRGVTQTLLRASHNDNGRDDLALVILVHLALIGGES